MKLTTGILAIAMMTGAAWGQNPGSTDNTRSTAKPQQTNTSASNAAGTVARSGQQAKPAPGAPASAVKPAAIPGAKPATVAAAKPAAAPAKAAAKPISAAAPSQHNKLEGVKVVRNSDDIQIEISSRDAVTPRVSKLSSPARVVVELPATIMATAQNKIPVGGAGVKGVRIGMDGKTPPTTSVVVDLDQACTYELTPATSTNFKLILHTQALAKSATSPAKTSASAPKQQIAAAKPVVAAPAAAQKTAPAKVASSPKTATQVAEAAKGAAKTTGAAATKTAAPAATKTVAAKAAPATTKIAAGQSPVAASKKPEAAKAPKPEEKKWAMNGKRDPFFSPVVQQTSGSGCSTGKKCLEIGQINVRGVVKAESGFIAVVTNSLNKAYFLHENDPVFNGFVVRITGDSVVFQETVQDKLGKPFTREVVKRILTPAV